MTRQSFTVRTRRMAAIVCLGSALLILTIQASLLLTVHTFSPGFARALGFVVANPIVTIFSIAPLIFCARRFWMRPDAKERYALRLRP